MVAASPLPHVILPAFWPRHTQVVQRAQQQDLDKRVFYQVAFLQARPWLKAAVSGAGMLSWTEPGHL